ncbi:MAG: CopG family transcriptional regulator [Deltaproteobacteria bacterium]|nr:CopG family transcriptional regulator [Deltaproteobacteria bacterium]
MARSYIALLRKDPDSDYGVEFPDFPGCVTAGKTLDEAQAFAKEALELHLQGMVEDGQEIPEPSSVDQVFEGRWPTRGTVPFLVATRAPFSRVVRVNVTFRPDVLDVLDDWAEQKGLTRSAALERAVDRLKKTG